MTSKQSGSRPLLAGIDGCKGGWVCALRRAGSAHIEIKLLRHLNELPALRPAMAAIDMPIGLLDSAVKGGRDCERQARALLPGKASSVFTVPCRAALKAKTYEAALRLNRASSAAGIGISKQAFHILPKLRELDGFITRQRQRWLVEAHPELAFARLNAGKPVLAPKRKMAGRAARIKLLRRARIVIGQALATLPRTIAAADDIFDAIVLTITAERVLNRNAVVLGKGRDARGLRMEICF